MTITERSGEPRRYFGGEIRLEDTNIGTMFTVATGIAYDGDTRKLSMLLGGPTLIDDALAK